MKKRPSRKATAFSSRQVGVAAGQPRGWRRRPRRPRPAAHRLAVVVDDLDLDTRRPAADRLEAWRPGRRQVGGDHPRLGASRRAGGRARRSARRRPRRPRAAAPCRRRSRGAARRGRRRAGASAIRRKLKGTPGKIVIRSPLDQLERPVALAAGTGAGPRGSPASRRTRPSANMQRAHPPGVEQRDRAEDPVLGHEPERG